MIYHGLRGNNCSKKSFLPLCNTGCIDVLPGYHLYAAVTGTMESIYYVGALPAASIPVIQVTHMVSLSINALFV